MYDLFNPAPNSATTDFSVNNLVDFNDIKGLTYLPNFINPDQEKDLINSINSEFWLSDIKRRVQHYGYKYDYKARAIDYSMFLGSLPDWAIPFANRFVVEEFIDKEPDQLIVNEYAPGQGIANHVDCEPCFGETIISLSLGSTCLMDFINLKTKERKSILLEPRSLVVMTGEARHAWTHGIAQRKTDEFKGQNFPRKLRISMTFRKVLLK